MRGAAAATEGMAAGRTKGRAAGRTAQALKIGGITLKRAIKVVKDRADQRRGTEYLRPHDRPLTLENVPGVRVFVLGPPEDEDLLPPPLRPLVGPWAELG